MSELPKICGWFDDIPSLEPSKIALLVLNDLKELKNNHKLTSSHSWLIMFAKNALDLDKAMDQLRDSNRFTKTLFQINNWFKNAKEQNYSLSEILFNLHEAKYQKLTILKKFMIYFVEKDINAFNELLKHLESYVKEN
jgi:hypothetical protein